MKKVEYICPKHKLVLIVINVSYGNSIENDVVSRTYTCPDIKCGYRLERKTDG